MSVPPINWTILRSAVDHDEADMQALIALYLRQSANHLRKLRSAVKREDPGEVAALAHGFLGSSRCMGAVPIGKPLAALLKLGQSNRLGRLASPLVDQTEKELKRIGHFVKSPSPPSSEQADA